jgi:pimeloyl-ACP methyl ester carboxylesterase
MSVQQVFSLSDDGQHDAAGSAVFPKVNAVAPRTRCGFAADIIRQFVKATLTGLALYGAGYHGMPLDRLMETEPVQTDGCTHPKLHGQQHEHQGDAGEIRDFVHGGPVMLLGHSIGGLTVSAVAEAIPQHLRSIVYLSAFMLPTGMTAVNLTTYPTMASALVKECILADPQKVGAMRIDFRLDDTAYRDQHVRCLADRAIPLAGQNFMIEAVDAELGTTTQVHDLSTSHSSFAAQFAALAELLVSIATQPASSQNANVLAVAG